MRCRLADLIGTLGEAYAVEYLTDVSTGLLDPNANARVLTLARLGKLAEAEGAAERNRKLRARLGE